jgi:hypothetical protein
MRIAIVSALLVFAAATAFAQDRPAAAPAAPEEGKMACGEMLSQGAPMLEKMAEMHTLMAEELELHVKWLGKAKDKAVKAEVTAISGLAKEHKALAASFKKMAASLTKMKDLAPVAHDPKAMDPKLPEIWTKELALGKELGEMMAKAQAMKEEMLKKMKGDAPPPAAR